MYELLKILHFIGIALSVGAGFSFFALKLASSKWSEKERLEFWPKIFTLGKVSSIGLLILILSGVSLILFRGMGIFQLGGGFFHAKLTLVVIYIGLFGYSQVKVKKAKQANTLEAFEKAAKLTTTLLVLGVVMLVLAVLAFH